MSEVIIVALLSCVGTIVGSLLGILAANKLTNYRIEQLEKKVEKHNNLVERMYDLEKKVAIDEEEIDHLKGYHNHN
jgi:hypothetical protein